MSCLGSGEFPVSRGTFYLPLFRNRTVVGAGGTGGGESRPHMISQEKELSLGVGNTRASSETHEVSHASYED